MKIISYILSYLLYYIGHFNSIIFQISALWWDSLPDFLWAITYWSYSKPMLWSHKLQNKWGYGPWKKEKDV